MQKRKLTVALLDRLSPPGGMLFLILAAIIGALTGCAAVFFILLIELIRQGSFAMLSGLGVAVFVVVPVLGSVLAGPLIVRFAGEAKGHGVPEVMQALVQQGGRIRPRVALIKILA